ncbi:MAG: hypothetical protein DRJ42_16455 [Deltaproteobacteria bacterium]|nr:MAG: hypothetical protein DRJ42_16455 [Deltaproteobacteria bacterium]
MVDRLIQRLLTASLLASVALVATTATAQDGQDGQSAQSAQSAQDASEDDVARAEELATAARDAAAAGHLDAAASLLREALTAAPRRALAFNLTLVLRDAGKFVEAIEVIDELLGGRWGELPDDRRAQADELRSELSGGVATLIIRVSGADRVTLRLDGEPVADAVPGASLRLQVNPGDHRIEAEADGAVPVTRSIEAAVGRSATVTLALEPANATDPIFSPPDTPGEPDDDGAGVSPWVFVAIGVAVLAAGGIALGVALGSSGDDPTAGLPPSYLGRAATLTWP